MPRPPIKMLQELGDDLYMVIGDDDAGGFVTGLIAHEGVITRSPPGFSFLDGMTEDEAVAAVEDRGWMLSKVMNTLIRSPGSPSSAASTGPPSRSGGPESSATSPSSTPSPGRSSTSPTRAPSDG